MNSVVEGLRERVWEQPTEIIARFVYGQSTWMVRHQEIEPLRVVE